ncbi:MAG: cytochrome-c oxidase, cbb3-type subunit III [Gammaproteobacteria bacterium]|nr:cytochrome-c oxidase, cbb3-type subunit III [Gammaproteobacteria bacterium]
MSSGWSWWVIGLIIFNLGGTFLLFLWAPRARVPVLPDGTTGHVWAHGALREGMHRLPGWWIALSFSMYAVAIGYLVLYPGFGNRVGTLEWTSAKELAAATAANSARLDPLLARLTTLSVEALADDVQARRLGERLFIDNCAACHDRSARGNALLGAPDLTDGDWLFGGTGADITTSIRDGRAGVMPPWNALGEATVRNLAQHVLSLAGQPHDAAAATAAAPIFQSTCSACHGQDGRTHALPGVPDLTDSVWLYGGTPAAIETTIRDGRQGQMPAWTPRLSDADIHVLAGYVYHLSHRGNATTP